MTAEGLIREELNTHGVTMLPLAAFDGWGADITVHSAIMRMQNAADVSSASCMAALAKMRDTPLGSRHDLGLGGKWFFVWLTRMMGDIMVYVGV